ncbi:MAG: hypothetical protein AYK19_21110 [Theionarchaea archaeon DG-70-1]|uniref:NAD(+) hydrolase TcpA n=1 Tax=Theionarchaea archaeon (strain DG-70-1) TaxID=1803814 RepID=TCPA_THEAD|nr:RecName: Full=NAD(+) hydrolase TcpA; AltName: Full=TIR domain-containing protein in T.archaeon; Short=tcpA [Theionarchaea archaeon DG-70-1]KYK27962.1 MAG: hypothetical protein AYK19_21110 [Theionarchaea archaeon DG-70-1]
MAKSVSISYLALEQIFNDTIGAGEIKVAGLLVGHPVNGGVHIARTIPTSRGTVTYVRISAEEISRAVEELNPGEKIVGWYHSRPGQGVFFSQDDIETHEKCLDFNPYFQALVIDPHQAKYGTPMADCVRFYTVRNHKEVPIHGYKLTGSSMQSYYDPKEFVFDKYGFPHHYTLTHAGKTKISHRKSNMDASFEYDVFICHAHEDKEFFVRELAEKLHSKGLRVWYDEFTLSLGDNLRRSIENGLAKSRYGIVVLSKRFFEKEWPQKELDGLVAKEVEGKKVILPVWHGITREEVQSFSSILANRLAASSEKGIDYVVNEILRVLRKKSV